MANKNHALDKQIITAALNEFLENGYEKASLRKIAAAADVTVGAIYTRYKTKDILFCSLVQPLIMKIQQTFNVIRSEYAKGADNYQLEDMASNMQKESNAILHLLFDDYDRAVLLFCQSAGSSLANFSDTIVQHKIDETLAFFKSAGIGNISPDILRLLTTAQFHMYFQIINDGYELEEARQMMNAAIIYHTGGWLAFLDSQDYKDKREG